MKRRTSKGKTINLEELIAQTPTTPALGNMGVNALGDKLGPGGQVVESSTRRVRAYYKDNPSSSTQNVSLKGPLEDKQPLTPDVPAESESQSPQEEVGSEQETKQKPKSRRATRKKKSQTLDTKDAQTENDISQDDLQQESQDQAVPDTGYDVASIEVETPDGDIVMMTPEEYQEYQNGTR